MDRGARGQNAHTVVTLDNDSGRFSMTVKMRHVWLQMPPLMRNCAIQILVQLTAKASGLTGPHVQRVTQVRTSVCLRELLSRSCLQQMAEPSVTKRTEQ